MNDGGNNFSNIRNAEINRLGPKYISPMFYEKYNVHHKMKECNAYEDEKYIVNQSLIWKRGTEYQHKKKNQRINMNYDKQYCIINDAIDNMDTVDRLKELYKNERNDFLVLSNRISSQELQSKLDSMGFDRMKCYSYTDCSEEELINYFKMMYKNDNCEHEVIQSENDLYNNFITNNTSLTTRHEVVNTIIDTYNYNSYLEIGVENGITFKNIKLDMSKKVGVDPDPTYKEENIILKTSDVFFKENNKIFDIIFIDGMHQLEYVYNDFFNSINCLTPKGSIVIDDVLPMNEREQYKIPIEHYYNNGILKYGESWTGDVWKFIYFLLLHYQFDFSVYNFTNGYRGMIHIYNFKNEINDEIDNTKVIETMNSYEYNTDYDKYLKYINARREVLTANSQKVGYWRPKNRPIGVEGVVLA
jgi:hypothetical protein